jgi:hypothetical protein
MICVASSIVLTSSLLARSVLAGPVELLNNCGANLNQFQSWTAECEVVEEDPSAEHKGQGRTHLYDIRIDESRVCTRHHESPEGS